MGLNKGKSKVQVGWEKSENANRVDSFIWHLRVVLIRGISTMVNCTLLNFGKRYKDNLMVIFYQCPKLHLGALSNKKTLKGV